MENRDRIRLALGLVMTVAGAILVALLFSGAGHSQAAAAPLACVAGPHTGTLAADETWCKSDSPHVVNVQFTVPSGVKLSIEPGATVMTNLVLHKDFLVEGQLLALGTPAEPITFTSAADTGPMQWGGLAFDGGTGHLRHATVRYGGQRSSVSDLLPYAAHRANIALHDSTLVLENVTVRDIASNYYDYGLLIIDSQVMMTDTLLTNIGGSAYAESDAPIRILGKDSELEMSGCTFTANENDLIFLDPSAMMGHDTTLTAQAGLGGYVLEQGFSIPPTVTLTLEPGVTIRGIQGGNDAAELLVEGHLQAIGTPTRPITFTSFHDSDAAQWKGIAFDGSKGAGTGHLRYATVRHGGLGNSVLYANPSGYHSGSNITIWGVQSGEVRLEQVTVESEYHFDGWHKFLDHGLYVNNSQVMVADSIIRNNCDSHSEGSSSDSGVFVTGDSQVIIEDSLIQSNSAPGLLVEGDTALVKVTGSSIVNNIGDGVRNKGAASVILSGEENSGNSIHSNQGFGVNQAGTSGLTMASYNWWNSASGPSHAGNPGGTGEEVSDGVFYDPWLTAAPTPPAVAAGMVQLAVPNEASVGQTVNFGVLLQNLHTETLQDAIVVLEIPWRAEYLYSSHDGQFWPLHNRVIWKLGDVAPGETFSAIAQVRFKWHTPNGTGMQAAAMVAADNYRNEWVTYEQHLAYQELQIDSQQELTQGQVDTILANDAELNGLYQHALAQGFKYYGNAVQLEVDGGIGWFEMLLLDPDHPGEMLAVRRIGDDRHIRLETEAHVDLYTLSGGSRFDYATTEWEFWGDLMPTMGQSTGAVANRSTEIPQLNLIGATACNQHNWGDCLRNCLINQIPKEMSTPSLSASKSSCDACVSCEWNCLDACSDCARDLWEDHHHEHYHDCTKECADSSNWNNYQCDEDKVECYDAPRNQSQIGRSQYQLVYKCDGDSCKYKPNPTLEYCPNGCVWGETAGGFIKTDCVPCEGFLDYVTEAQCIRALTAHDPNALYGPAVAAPGQTLEYTVEWENEGKGIAYGVYVEADLPPELDDSSLQIGGNGVYFPGSRTLMWHIGELGAGAGDSVTFTVQVPASTVSGTVMVAEATVYFPSVPETTPTNPVVTVVQDVSAAGQRVETDPNTPVAIKLEGYTPTGSPLVFTVTEMPENGSLKGTAPNLTYTPFDEYVGGDGLAFAVSDGLNTSLPAMVTIVVKPWPRVYLPQVLRKH